MKKEAEVYFHLGMSKVASTYFQELVFPNLADVNYFPKHRFKRFKNLSPAEREGKLLFSSEKDKRIVEAVEEIVAVFPDARIILFVRRHDDWLLSRYKYRIRKNGGEHFSEFFDLETDSGLWKKDTLLYRNKIEAIEKLCTSRPLILSYDLLKKSPGEFIGKLTSFMGTSLKAPLRKKRSINTAFNEKQLIFLRRFNRFYPYRQHHFRNKNCNKIYEKYRQFLLHAVAFLLHLVPGFLVRNKTLLDEADKISLTRIREYYADDWKFCKEYDVNQ